MTLQWGYKRAFLRCALLFVAGVALQLAFGDLQNEFLRYPWGLIIAVNYLYLIVLAHFQKHRWKWLSTLGDHYACTSSLASMVALTILFGLTRQDPSVEGVVGALGFSRMTSSWEFNILLLYFTTTTGLAVMEDIAHLRQRRLAAVISHFAVFVVLVAGMFGSGDKLRVTVTTQEGRTSHVGVTRAGEQVQLPFTITLNDFRMEEYPPKLYLLNAASQSSSDEFLTVEEDGVSTDVANWHIEAVRSLDMAGYAAEGEAWQEMNHVGAAPAVYVRGTNRRTGEVREDWVSCGSFVFEPSYLFLTDRVAVAMPRREAKHYLSSIEVATEDGKRHNFDIEVNHPARVGAWRIYQMGYDTQRGRWSDVSVVECVRDGWYVAVQIALWAMLAAGVVMFLTAGGRRATKRGKEVRQ